MAAEAHVHYDLNEKFIFRPELKRKLMIGMGVGLLLFITGTVLVMMGVGSHHHEAHEASKAASEAAKHAGGEHHYNPLTRVWANLWLNGTFFTYISVMGLLFVAIQYIAYVGWSATIRRVAEAFGAFLPFSGAVLVITFFLSGMGHNIFHWTHHDLYEKGKPTFDPILAGKAPYFFAPLEAGSFPLFWFIRMIAYLTIWYILYRVITQNSIKEDFISDGTIDDADLLQVLFNFGGGC
jgi:magnesium-transporting ATPase (P-type)